MKENLKCILLNECSQSGKDYVLYDSNYMPFWKRQNYGDSIKISDRQDFGRWEGRTNRWSVGNFRTVEYSRSHLNCGYITFCICPNPWANIT